MSVIPKERRRRIFLNQRNTKWCKVRLFQDKKEMQAEYKKFTKGSKNKSKILGANCPYDLVKVSSDGKQRISPEVSTIFLWVKRCGAGIVSHEFMHAVLWAWKHKARKVQYPIVIKSMKEEEEILHNHTHAVNQFYDWYWKVVQTD